MVGADLDDRAHEFLENLAYVSKKNGKQTTEGYLLPFSAIDFGEEKENRRMLGELEKKHILETILPDGDQEDAILYDRNLFNRIKKLKSWINNFKMAAESPGGA